MVDLRSCRINIESSDIKVSCRALILMKGRKIGNLYLLQGSTMTGKTTSPLFVKEPKSTRLKQRQFGHKREKGMTILNKRSSFLGAGFGKIEHCVRGKKTRISFDLAVHKSKTRSLQFQSSSTTWTQLISCKVQDRPVAGSTKKAL
ncbi:hypothetical protein V6Z12_D10G169700 [Gossypium hirsutum]